jgi:ankyrin repeat protein
MESLERVMDHHPDVSFWTAPNQQEVRDSPRHSSLSTANPLTVAIQESHTQVIQRLLQADFNPNIYQSSTPTVAVTPLMATAMLGNHDAGVRYFELLVKESKHPIDLTVRTPIFGINIFHMAAASLSLPMLKAIATHSPSKLIALKCKTALQHSPLHIACLTLDDSHINWQSLATATSIKDVRTLDPDWYPQHPPASYSKVDLEDKVELDVEPNSSLALPQTTEYFKAQYDVIKFLLDACQRQAAANSRDLYGNTPLHYLASYRKINMDALELLLESEESQEAWMEAQNEWGYTPHDLFEKGTTALNP